MTNLVIGDKAPDFALFVDGGGSTSPKISLSGLKGQKVVIYFYPKDDTPGCTKEACAFRDGLPAFIAENTQIIGISKDSVAKHDKFKTKYGLNFPLAADEDGKVCKNYGVWVEKNMYGRKYMGIERATFLIDEQGIIRQIWRKVKVPGHAEDILETIQGLD